MPGSSGATSGPPGDTPRIGTDAESHEFERVVQDLEVRRNGTLIYRDRFAWNGPWDEATSRWHVGGHPAIATAGLFVTGSLCRPTIGPESTFQRVALPLAHGDTLVRWCGPPPAITTDLVKTALTAAAGWSGGDSAPPWLIGANHLGQNHWFSP